MQIHRCRPFINMVADNADTWLQTIQILGCRYMVADTCRYIVADIIKCNWTAFKIQNQHESLSTDAH